MLHFQYACALFLDKMTAARFFEKCKCRAGVFFNKILLFFVEKHLQYWHLRDILIELHHRVVNRGC